MTRPRSLRPLEYLRFPQTSSIVNSVVGYIEARQCNTVTQLNLYRPHLQTSRLKENGLNRKIIMADDKKRQAKRVAAENGVFVSPRYPVRRLVRILT
jgi:hypothetical protein